MTLTVRIPFEIRKHGGRKLMVSPGGASAPARPRVDNALVKALARAHRWKRRLEEDDSATIEEIAAAEKISASYVSRVIRLTFLSPDLVEAILAGRQPAALTLKATLQGVPKSWSEQADLWPD